MENELNTLNEEYRRMMLSQKFDRKYLDYDLVKQHIEIFSKADGLQNAAITIYDNYQFRHVYVSDYHRRLIGDGDLEIHPDDLSAVMKNAIATVKHIFQGNRNATHIKTVREYRAKIRDRFRKVTESIRVLETDCLGNIWLVLCILEISPNQLPPFSVNSQIVNTLTGEVFSPLTEFYQKKSVLTARETEILGLIAQGRLSKEISEQLHISVHTVNTIRQHILEKFNVDNSHEAVRYGQSLGLIEY